MSAAALPFETPPAATATPLDGLRARGGVAIGFKSDGAGGGRLADLHEWGGYRAKLPRPLDSVAEAVLINTGGGLLGGDAIAFDVAVGAGASALVTSQSAERVYRSLGSDCRVGVTLRAASAARLMWLPQETILFDAARLRRTITAELARDASLLLVEATVFGRAAMDEVVRSGTLRDVWRIRRDGQLIYADNTHIDGAIHEQLLRPAFGNGATAMATVLYVAADAADRLARARSALEHRRARAAVSAWNGRLVGRLLAPGADALKADLTALVEVLSDRPVPRVWGRQS